MSPRLHMAAWGDLMARYGSVFRHFWGQRHSMQPNLFNQQEAEFMPAALSLQESPQSPSLRITARVLMALVTLTLVWSVVGKVDIVVNAVGKIIPAARTKTIASVDVASVRALHVTEGQRVHAGDLLVELDSSGSDSERDKARDRLDRGRLQLARAKAMVLAVNNAEAPQLEPIEGSTPALWRAAEHQLAVQYQDFHARLVRLDDEIGRYDSATELATQRAHDLHALLEQHDVSRHAWIEAEQSRVDMRGQLSSMNNQRIALRAETLKLAHEEMLEASKIIVASEQDEHRAGVRSNLLSLTAPVDGTVQQLTVHTIGGVVPAAQPLMQIVPADAPIEVEAFVENKDVGFVHPGQTVAVKIDAFDYTRYGTTGALVSHVSQDAIQDEKRGLIYGTRIALDKDTIFVDGKALPLAVGMSVNVEIKTGTRRVIEYILSPLMRHQREALHER